MPNRRLLSRTIPRSYWPVLWIVGICAVLELGTIGYDIATGTEAARYYTVEMLGFWPSRLEQWGPGWDPRSVTMFATYWAVHAGFDHFLGNMLILIWLARQVDGYLQGIDVIEIWAASVLGGAAAFSLLDPSFAPMVGASGGVFGLLGAVVVLRHRAALDRSPSSALWQTFLACLGILVLSVVDYIIRDAILAWQAHLGGFLAGAAIAAAQPARTR